MHITLLTVRIFSSGSASLAPASSPATGAGHPKETKSFFMKVPFAGTSFYSEERIGFYGKEDYCSGMGP